MRIFYLHIFYFLIFTLLIHLKTTTTTEILYCSIHFIVDYPLWTLTFLTRAERNYFRTNTLLSSYIYRNVEGLNELYKPYRFPYKSQTKNITIQFFVHGITVVTQNVCDQKDDSYNQPDNPLREFCASDIQSDALLDLIARFGDYHKKTSTTEAACLNYGITSRKLKLQNNTGSALGWSWRGHLCSDLEEFSNWSPKNSFNPRYSGNVGVVTTNFDASDYSLNKYILNCFFPLLLLFILLFGNKNRGEMTFFHEVGHSMNADHDNAQEFKSRKKECNPPDSQGGKYLMYPTGTEGLLPNNRAYSHCSLDTISKYTESLSYSKPKCLSNTKEVKSKCDGIFSSDEICDEHGTDSKCCTSDCKLKSGAVCSPSAGLCCQSSCQYHSVDYECLPESECKLPIKCLGTSAHCRDSDSQFFKADYTVCRDGTLLCINGSCELSICALHSLLPCQLQGSENDLCLIACLKKDGSCVPYHTINTSLTTSKPLYFPYGASCNAYQGYCDQSHRCLPLLLDQNTNFISAGFSTLLLTNYSAVFKKYWWIFLIFILAQIILIPIVLLYFRSHCIPTDNPFLQ